MMLLNKSVVCTSFRDSSGTSRQSATGISVAGGLLVRKRISNLDRNGFAFDELANRLFRVEIHFDIRDLGAVRVSFVLIQTGRQLSHSCANHPRPMPPPREAIVFAHTL